MDAPDAPTPPCICGSSTFLLGSNSSMRLRGQAGSFSSVSVSHCVGSMSLALAVPSGDWRAAARLPADPDHANNQYPFPDYNRADGGFNRDLVDGQVATRGVASGRTSE